MKQKNNKMSTEVIACKPDGSCPPGMSCLTTKDGNKICVQTIPALPSQTAVIVQAAVAGLGAGLFEAGVVLRGARLPVGGKVAAVAAAAAGSSALGRLASSYADQYYAPSHKQYILDAVSAGLVAALVSAMLDRQASDVRPATRGMIVGLAVALTPTLLGYAGISESIIPCC